MPEAHPLVNTHIPVVTRKPACPSRRRTPQQEVRSMCGLGKVPRTPHGVGCRDPMHTEGRWYGARSREPWHTAV